MHLSRKIAAVSIVAASFGFAMPAYADECTAEGGQLQRVRIGGHAVKVAEGSLNL